MVLATVGRLVVNYLVAGVVETAVFSLARGGHADVPFSGFPGFLLFSPVVPVEIAVSLSGDFSALEFASTLVFVAVFVALWMVQHRRPRRGV